MGTKERLKHVAAGIADSFFSRHNDLSGYWAPGLMYREVASPPHDVLLDLLRSLAAPAMPYCRQAASKYAMFVDLAAAKKLLPHETLTYAVIEVQFNVQFPASQRIYGTGDPCNITVVLQACGTEGRAKRAVRCLPFVEGKFTRRSPAQ